MDGQRRKLSNPVFHLIRLDGGSTQDGTGPCRCVSIDPPTTFIYHNTVMADGHPRVAVGLFLSYRTLRSVKCGFGIVQGFFTLFIERNEERRRDMYACSPSLSTAVLPFFIIIIAAVVTPQLNTFSTTMIMRILRRERMPTQPCQPPPGA
jgi:hypothetical protein